MKDIRQNVKSGFSLVEVIIMVAIMGIMAAVGVVAFGKVTKASKETIAQNLVETLNNATKEFGHAQYPLASSGEDTEVTDEVLILQTLQWRDPSIELGVAGPFMKGDWIPATSSSTDDYRAVWSGSFWKVARPGETGAGLKMDFEARDVGTKFTHPDDFAPFAPQTDPIDVDLSPDETTMPPDIDLDIPNVAF